MNIDGSDVLVALRKPWRPRVLSKRFLDFIPEPTPSILPPDDCPIPLIDPDVFNNLPSHTLANSTPLPTQHMLKTSFNIFGLSRKYLQHQPPSHQN